MPLAPLLCPLLRSVLYIRSTPQKIYPPAVLTGLPTPAVYRTQERLYLYDLLVLVCGNIVARLGVRSIGVLVCVVYGTLTRPRTFSLCQHVLVCVAPAVSWVELPMCRNCCVVEVSVVQTVLFFCLAVVCCWTLLMTTVDLTRAACKYRDVCCRLWPQPFVTNMLICDC